MRNNTASHRRRLEPVAAPAWESHRCLYPTVQRKHWNFISLLTVTEVKLLYFSNRNKIFLSKIKWRFVKYKGCMEILPEYDTGGCFRNELASLRLKRIYSMYPCLNLSNSCFYFHNILCISQVVILCNLKAFHTVQCIHVQARIRNC
jgi:hypothetical protein